MNLLELEEIRKMREEGHGDDTLVDGIGVDQREPVNLHFANGAIWIPVK